MESYTSSSAVQLADDILKKKNTLVLLAMSSFEF